MIQQQKGFSALIVSRFTPLGRKWPNLRLILAIAEW